MSSTVALKEVANFSDTRIHIDDVSLDNFITTDNMLQNKLGITKAIALPPQDGNMPKYQKNNILIANIRPYLKKIWFADKDGGCSADVLVLNVKDEYDAKFIYYALLRDDFFAHVMNGAKGTKMPRGDKKQIMDFIIPKFDISTQQKIAKVLSTLDRKIELNNQINQNLEAMAKTLYDYWFVQFDFPNANGNGKPYKSSGGKMVYSEELKREIPEGWEVKELGEVIEIHDSKRIPLARQERESRIGIYPYYGATSIMGYVDDYIFEGEYILLAEDGSVMDDKGFPIIQHVKGKIWVNNHAHVLTPKDENYFEYLFYSLKMISVVKIMTGSIQKKINQENLQSVPILLPSNVFLKKFANVVDPIRNKLISNITETQKLTQLRDWLLPMLMNGQVSVSEATEQVEQAEELMVAEPSVGYGSAKENQ